MCRLVVVLNNNEHDLFFTEPTIITGLEGEMQIAHEEVIGPLLLLMKVSNFEEAVGVANKIEYGLSAISLRRISQKPIGLSRGLW